MSLHQGSSSATAGATANAAANTSVSVNGTSGQGLSRWEYESNLSDTPSDAVDSYFHCITTCSLEDGDCITRCVEELRELA